MSAEPGIWEAVRQLGRAVVALLRAVVGAGGRKHPAATERSESGPPQEWLDLVAETDPDWLARSPWADRGERRRPAPRSRRQQLDTTTRAVQDDEPVLEQERVATEVVQDHWPSSVPSARTPKAPEADERVPLRDAGEAVRHHAARPQPRRLVLVEPVADTVPTMRRPLPETPTPPTEAALADLAGPRASSTTGDFPRHRPLAKAPAPWEEAPSLGKWEVREGTDAQGPTLEHREAVREERELRRQASETGPLPAHVREMPGTWTPTPIQGPRPALLPPERPLATPSAWPELPRTESLDEPHPTPGLAARLWLADDRPDTLTTAQRRS